MIHVTQADIGRAVICVPFHARGDRTHPGCERGVITSFNDSYVFVRYGAPGCPGVATWPQNLEWA
jgi:hypothetical protein